MERYFYDQFTERCVKFGGCSDIGEDENNFESKDVCSQTCLEAGDSSLALTDESSSHSAGTIALEVVLSLIFIALIIIASYLGWKHYNLRRNNPDTYRLFRDQRSNSVIGVMNSGDSGHRSAMSTYNNPAFNTDFREHLERRDSVVEVISKL